MRSNVRVIAALIGAAVGVSLASATHHPSVWLPLGIGVGLAVGIALHDRKNQARS